MPLKDPEAKRAYQRMWYAAHRERVIAAVRKRKYEDYAGKCVNCGGPTVGISKGKAPRYCGKKECRKEQWREKKRDREASIDSSSETVEGQDGQHAGRADD